MVMTPLFILQMCPMQQYKLLEQAFHGTKLFWLTTFPHDERIDSRALTRTSLQLYHPEELT